MSVNKRITVIRANTGINADILHKAVEDFTEMQRNSHASQSSNLIDIYEEAYSFVNREPTIEDFDRAFYYTYYACKKSLSNRELVFYISKKFLRRNNLMEDLVLSVCKKFFGFFESGPGAIEFSITRQGVKDLQEEYDKKGNDEMYSHLLTEWRLKDE